MIVVVLKNVTSSCLLNRERLSTLLSLLNALTHCDGNLIILRIV